MCNCFQMRRSVERIASFKALFAPPRGAAAMPEGPAPRGLDKRFRIGEALLALVGPPLSLVVEARARREAKGIGK